MLQMLEGGTSLRTLARIKESIVLRGGVMTSMVIWSDFRRYPAASPTGVYNTTRRPAREPKGSAELHAVFCYGWKDESASDATSNASPSGSGSGYLLCKNSWGTGWGLNGTFKIAYGAAFVLQPDYTFAMEFRKFARAQEAASILNNNVERVLDPAYPGCWLFRPPRPMRLLHVAEYVWRMSRSPAANISSFDGGESQGATGRAAQLDQARLTKLDILEDIILGNLLYNGLGTADAVQSAANPSAVFLLNALVGSKGATKESSQPSSFLICNKTAGLLVGPAAPPPPLQCPPGTRADTDLTRCETCPDHHYRSQELPACTPCPAGTGTVLSAFALDHDGLSDCAPLVEDGERLIGFYGRKTLADMDAALGALGVICGKPVKSSLKEVFRSGVAGSSNDVGTSMRFESKCPSGAFVAEIKGWSSNVLDGLQVSCSDGTVLTALGGNQTGSPVTAASSQGFTRITAYVALEEQNIPELEIPAFNVTRVVGLTAVDSSGAITSWGVSSSTVGAFNESILSCDGASGNGRIITAFGTVLINLYVEDPAKWPFESLGVACGGIQKCEYS
eukprot:gene7185-7399_t